MKRFIATTLLVLVSGFPVLAIDAQRLPIVRRVDRDRTPIRVVGDDDSMSFSFRGTSGRTLRGSVDRSTGTITMNGLSLQALPGVLSFSFNGDRVTVPVSDVGEFTSHEDANVVAELVGRWRSVQNPSDLEEMRTALEPSSRPSMGKTGRMDTEEIESACGWKIAKLFGVTLAATAACGSTGLGCLGGYIAFIVTLKETADTCGWCGFGTAC